MTQATNDIPNGLDDSPRGRILTAAAHLFRIKGFERTTVRDLANEVGIQSGSIFHHFKTKEEILCHVMIEVILFNTERMRRELQAAESVRDKLLALVRAELVSINGDTGEAMAVLTNEWRSLKPDSQQQILTLRDRYEQMWLQTLDEAKASGLIASEVDTFILRRLLTGALAWSNFWYDPTGPMNIDALAKQALALVVKS
ncbi:MAG: TetR family transcriptional regulator [Gammaproteobacteria bacterium]|nr:MAG: TetR family transcriptional regulator [Gammaproteobacteria bacterium]